MVAQLLGQNLTPADASQLGKGYQLGRQMTLQQQQADQAAAAAKRDQSTFDLQGRYRTATTLGNSLAQIEALPEEQRAPAFEQFKRTALQLEPENANIIQNTTLADLPGLKAATTEQLNQLQQFQLEQAKAMAPYQLGKAQLDVDAARVGIDQAKYNLQSGRRIDDVNYQGAVLKNQDASLDIDEKRARNDYYANIMGQESGGDPNARAATSTASGLYQFTGPTWQGVVNSPEGQRAGLTIEGKNDPRQQEAGVRILTEKNGMALSAADIPVTQKTLRMAHFLGASGAVKFMNAPENAPAADYVDRGAVAANRSVFYDKSGRARTVAEVYDNQTRGYPNAPIGGAGAAAAPAVSAPGAAPPLLAAPAAAPAAGSLANARPVVGTVGGTVPGRVVPGGAPSVPAGAGPGPVSGPGPGPATTGTPVRGAAAPPSVADMAASDPQMLDWQRQIMQAERFGNKGEVDRLQSLQKLRIEEYKAQAKAATSAVSGAGVKLTESQSKDVSLLTRARAANSVLDQNEEALRDSYWSQRAYENLPFGLGNYGMGAEYQRVQPAVKEFINAVNRKDSGAAISESEWQTARERFIPQPGDGPDTIAAKRTARAEVENAFGLGLGGLVNLVPNADGNGAQGQRVPGQPVANPTATAAGTSGSLPNPADIGADEGDQVTGPDGSTYTVINGQLVPQ